MDVSSLERLGLGPADIKVYMALLRRGQCTATQVSQATRLNRSHVYEKLDALLEKGLISCIVKEGTRRFEAGAPEKLLDYVEEVQRGVVELIPELRSLKRSGARQTVVELYQGREGMKTVFKDVLREGKDYYVLGEEGKFQELLPVFIAQFLRDVSQRGMREHLLSKESKRGTIALAKRNSSIRYLPDRYFSPAMTCVYGDKTAIWIWSEPLFAILIHDKDLAASFRSYFDLLWAVAAK